MRTKTKNKFTRIFIFFVLMSFLFSGCVSLYGRKRFAQQVFDNSSVIREEYKSYVEKDANLSDEDKQTRLKTLQELENFLKEGVNK